VVPNRLLVAACDAEGDDDDEGPSQPEPFTLAADWDDGPELALSRWRPQPTRFRGELLGTRWRARNLKADLYRDDPPT
jgi:hypothetical protein